MTGRAVKKNKGFTAAGGCSEPFNLRVSLQFLAVVKQEATTVLVDRKDKILKTEKAEAGLFATDVASLLQLVLVIQEVKLLVKRDETTLRSEESLPLLLVMALGNGDFLRVNMLTAVRERKKMCQIKSVPTPALRKFPR